ncbi:MAG TPA: chromosome segregation protein SMC [Thermoanaerobaculia bacterium]|nr:chromosome segregation protein SMC [Thermoanaerobaculia bacterium]
MFKLERVQISGFKSFYEKVDLEFPGSVTAVVGPNGCGKSNISDAVSWALGEQSAKTLRGERMDDVIFNGSSKRRPLGMAEVILTLSTRARTGGVPVPIEAEDGNGNGNGNGNGHESEVLRIGRRVYREGTGEYFLNDKQVRLKDIQDRLLGTGLGVRAYSVIEQGRIDQVLSTKPQDRRRLIEEAAGITRYKLKKRLAEGKLEETRGNLLRISDIVAEIERNAASLKRQASRAARYREHTETLRGKKAALARTRHDVLLAAVSEAERVRDERRDREAEAAAALGRAEAELASARVAAAEIQSERDRLRDAVAALENAIQRDDALLESNRRAGIDLAERRALLEREGRDVSAEQVRSARELAELEERLERAIADARARSQAREESDERAAAAAEAFDAIERELEGAREGALLAAGDRVQSRNARHEVDLEASRVAASLARAAEMHERVGSQLAERQAEVERALDEERRLSDEAAAARRQTEEWEAELARLAGALSDAELARDRARESLSVAEHRLAALNEILKSRQDSVESVRSALRAAGIPEEGSLADRLRPSIGWEATIDLLLADDVEAIFASGDARAAIEASRGLSSASFVRSDWRAAPGASAAAGSLGGWEVALENHSSLSAAERAALPAVAFVETLDDALSLSARYPSDTFVTRGRELVRGSLVRVVHTPAEASGLFALRREVDRLDGDAARSRESAAALEKTVEDLRRARQECEGGMPARRELEREAAGRLSEFVGRFEERRAERDRLSRERETLASELHALSEEAARLASRKEALEAEESAHGTRELEIRQRAETLAGRLPEARSLAAAAAEELAHRRTEAEVAAERRRALDAAREKLLETRGHLERRIGDAFEEGNRLALRAEELAREEKEARERRAANLAGRETGAAELAAVSEAAAESATRVGVAEEGTKTLRGSLDSAREARFEAEVSETRVRADLDHLIAQAREEFGVAPEELAAPEDRSPEALAALELEVAALAQAIERLGPVNVLALEEHREMTERLTFLSTQRDDLLKSISELQESIRKINATSSERFRHAFEAVNENFKTMFSRLFQGGTAEMRLLDETDLLESGVEIVAQPPGKRNQSIQLLSGGEKALTAIALLMAIFRYKPSPFCILDEVDAPLDEANIDRFTRLLRDMTEDTQFIAITHNKRTMETADVMYGVTMEEPGCSKIVSVRFD